MSLFHKHGVRGLDDPLLAKGGGAAELMDVRGRPRISYPPKPGEERGLFSRAQNHSMDTCTVVLV